MPWGGLNFLLFGIKETTQALSGNILRWLTEDGITCSSVKLPMVGNCERFFLAPFIDPAQFDMAAALRVEAEAKRLQNRNDFGERRRSLGIRWSDFHRHEEGRGLNETEITQVLAFQMQGNCFLEILHRFIKCRALGDYRDFKAFGNIPRIPLPGE
jgi:hypothetical protein